MHHGKRNSEHFISNKMAKTRQSPQGTKQHLQMVVYIRHEFFYSWVRPEAPAGFQYNLEIDLLHCFEERVHNPPSLLHAFMHHKTRDELSVINVSAVTWMAS
jgi:hypothetical protein